MPVTKLDFISKTKLYRHRYPLVRVPEAICLLGQMWVIYMHIMQVLREHSFPASATGYIRFNPRHAPVRWRPILGGKALHNILNKAIIKANIIQMDIQSIMCYGILI